MDTFIENEKLKKSILTYVMKFRNYINHPELIKNAVDNETSEVLLADVIFYKNYLPLLLSISYSNRYTKVYRLNDSTLVSIDGIIINEDGMILHLSEEDLYDCGYIPEEDLDIYLDDKNVQTLAFALENDNVPIYL